MHEGYTLIDRGEFDRAARSGEFAEGPWVSSFGDGWADPYVPVKNREVRGTLKDGRRVRADGERVA